MFQIQTKSASHLITAYNQMMEEMRTAFEQSDPQNMSLQKALDLARQHVVILGEVTAEEAHEIGEYIKRDINDAAEYMMDVSAEFYEWLMLDIEIIERKVMELFLTVAEHTRVELEHFTPDNHYSETKESEHVPVYNSGEITGPGSLICESCGSTRVFLKSSQITNCDACGHHRFIRRFQEDNQLKEE